MAPPGLRRTAPDRPRACRESGARSHPRE
jgi:hypothetical protein